MSGADATVTYRLLEEWHDLEDAAKVLAQIWEDPTLASAGLLRAYTHFGNPVLGAFDGGALCGVSVGFLAPAGGVHLHSHITGVLPTHQHLGIGFGLKVAQRRWCLEHGVDEVTWTFDPMIARNAHFNLNKLGASADSFLPQFYGEMHDAFNAGEITDRLEAHWRVGSAQVADTLGGRRARPATVARRVAIPRDYPALRAADAAAARQERLRVRAELADAFAAGLVITSFSDASEYCFQPA